MSALTICLAASKRRARLSAKHREGGLGRPIDDFEKGAGRAARRAFALLPVAHRLDRNADLRSESGLRQSSSPAHIARVHRILEALGIVAAGRRRLFGKGNRPLTAIR